MRCNHLLWVAEGQETGYPGTQMKVNIAGVV